LGGQLKVISVLTLDVEREMEKFIIRQPPIGEKDDVEKRRKKKGRTEFADSFRS